jgi:hypothetical protein
VHAGEQRRNEKYMFVILGYPHFLIAFMMPYEPRIWWTCDVWEFSDK